MNTITHIILHSKSTKTSGESRLACRHKRRDKQKRIKEEKAHPEKKDKRLADEKREHLKNTLSEDEFNAYGDLSKKTNKEMTKIVHGLSDEKYKKLYEDATEDQKKECLTQ